MKTKKQDKRRKNADTTAVQVYIPAHLNAALEAYQAAALANEGQAPSKQRVLIQSLAQFLATRVANAGNIATALILAVFLAGCAPLPVRKDAQDLAPLPVQVIRSLENMQP